MATIKIKFTNGIVDIVEFANTVKEALQEEGFKFIGMGYNPMRNGVVYHIEKDGQWLGEIGLPRILTQQEAVCTLKRIKEIKNSYTPPVEEIEFDL